MAEVAPATTPRSSGLRFDLPLGNAAAARATAAAAPMPPSARAGGGKFSFHSPQLQGSATGNAAATRTPCSAARFAAAAGGAGEGQKVLRAGYLSRLRGQRLGRAEVMRLNAVVDDLQTKARTPSASRPRAVGGARQRRAAVRARDLAALWRSPARSSRRGARGPSARGDGAAQGLRLRQAKVRDAARGRRLEAKYDDEVARAKALEEVLHGLRATHEAQTAQHEALQTRSPRPPTSWRRR